MAHVMPLATFLLFLAAGSPGSPQLIAPLDQTTIGWTVATTPRPPVVFSWQATAGTSTYRLRIATSEDFKHLVVDRTTARTSEDVRGLEPGKYFWKVTAMDGAGNDVSASTTARVIIQ
jgi:hypothetical protein